MRFPNTEPVGQDRNRTLLESAAYRPFQSACGTDIFPGLLDKTAALFHGLNADHPFENGCKRTAVIAVDLFLIANWHFLALPEDQIYELAIETADYKRRGMTQDEMLDRIKHTIEPHVVSIAALVFSRFFRLGWRVLMLAGAIRAASTLAEKNDRLAGW